MTKGPKRVWVCDGCEHRIVRPINVAPHTVGQLYCSHEHKPLPHYTPNWCPLLPSKIDPMHARWVECLREMQHDHEMLSSEETADLICGVLEALLHNVEHYDAIKAYNAAAASAVSADCRKEPGT